MVTDASLDALLWDSGAVLGDAAGVRYAGSALRIVTLYFWKVSYGVGRREAGGGAGGAVVVAVGG